MRLLPRHDPGDFRAVLIAPAAETDDDNVVLRPRGRDFHRFVNRVRGFQCGQDAFQSATGSRLPALRYDDTRNLNHLIEAAKSEVYTSRHGETRPKSGLIQKEDADGAV